MNPLVVGSNIYGFFKLIIMKKCLLSILLLASGFSLFAQKQWTLQECLQYALDNNLDLKKKALDVKLSKADKVQSYFEMVPTIIASGNLARVDGLDYNYHDNRYENAVVVNGDMSLSGEVTLFHGFSLVNDARAARYDYERLKADLAVEQKNMSLRIAVKYIDVLFKRDLYNAAKQQSEISQQQLLKGTETYNLGGISSAEYLELKAQYSRNVADEVSYRNQYQQYMLELAQYLDVDSVQTFDIATPSSVDSAIVLDLPSIDYVLANSKRQFPEIKSVDNLVRTKEMNYYAALGRLSPRFYAGYSYRTWIADNGVSVTHLDGSGNGIRYPDYSYRDQIDENLRKTFYVGVSIPILNRYSAQTALAKSKINLKSVRYSYEQTENSVTKELMNSYLETNGAWSNYQAAKEKFNATSAAWDAAKEKFDLGGVSSIDLGIARKNQFEAETNLINSKYNFVLRKKILDYYMGIPLSL